MVAIRERSVRRHWSTADVESRHALEYWAEAICKSFLEIDIDSLAGNRFRARLDQSEFGPAMLHLIEAGRQSIRRTPARIAHSRYAPRRDAASVQLVDRAIDEPELPSVFDPRARRPAARECRCNGGWPLTR
jgi:hypothetical protein